MLHMTVSDMFPGNPQAQALAKAAEKGDIATMDKLVAAGADPNTTGTYGVTVPVWLLYHPNKAGFRRLLELGADPNKITTSEDGQENSLMHRAAARSGYIGAEYLQMAIDIGHGDPNLEVGRFRRTPIWYASLPNNIDAFAVLINAGVDINFTTSHLSKIYLVLETARSVNYKATLYLLQNGANYKKKTPSGYDVVRQMQYQINDGERCVTSSDSPQYMWFWRCVDFLEKRGETFTFTPKSVRPAVLDTTPPDIFAEAQIQQPDTPAKPQSRVSDTEAVSMHEVYLTYPVPFWLQGADATTGNTHSRMRQKAGFLAYDYVPKGQDFDRWQSSLGISTLYAPGNTWPQFSKAVQEGYASACGKNAQIDVVQDAANHRVLHLRCGEGEQQEGYLYLGVLKSTFVTVYQGWRNASPADAERYRAAALQGVGRIRLEPGMNVMPMP